MFRSSFLQQHSFRCFSVSRVAIRTKKKAVFDDSYGEALSLSSDVEKGICHVYCTSRKFDWPNLKFPFRPDQKGDWFVLKKEEFMLVKEKSGILDLFIFPYGAVVSFDDGSPTSQASDICKALGVSAFSIGPMKETLHEEYEWKMEDKVSIVVDRIGMSKDENELPSKLAVATGLAQSLKLDVFEEQVERAIELVEDIPEQISEKGELQISRREINKKYGELLKVRASINLHSDILDVPEFFWEFSEGPETYQSVTRYLRIQKRARTLNERLELLSDLYTTLIEQKDQKVSHSLEWLIIFLIAVEVIIGIGHIYKTEDVNIIIQDDRTSVQEKKD